MVLYNKQFNCQKATSVIYGMDVYFTYIFYRLSTHFFIGLLKGPVYRYGHVGTVTSDCVGKIYPTFR